ncbi:MAG: S8 family serine peptidase [Phycisphaeraceae bacterium]|nr:S8 family serine peptidase [Phycisphaeraceae bacterium]
MIINPDSNSRHRTLGRLAIGSAALVGLINPMAFGQATGKAVTAPSLRAVAARGITRVSTPDGRVIHETASQVRNIILTQVGGGEAVARWQEQNEAGVWVPWYSLSRDASSPLPTFEPARRTSDLLLLKYAAFDPLAAAPAVSKTLQAPSTAGVFIVQCICPPTDSFKTSLAAAGASPVAYLVNNALIVKADPKAAKAIGMLPFVRWVGPYHTAYKCEAALLESAAMGPVTVNVQTFERGPVAKGVVATRIEQVGGKVTSLIPEGFLVGAVLNRDQLLTILAMPEVQWVDSSGPTSVDMNLARAATGANFIESTLGFTGQGVRIEVMDDNVRETHVDFQSPPIIFHGPRSGSTNHGTCVMGIAIATGTGNGQGRGMLPSAEQGIFADKDLLTNRYTHTLELVDDLGPYRAVVQANAWGSEWTTTYATQSMQMDDILFNADLILTQSMSNLGNQLARPEAWAKNIVACGGILHNDTLTRADDSWGGFVSIGPAADGRIKPDLSHFADSIFCTFDGSDTDYIGGFDGSSSSTGITAGAFGLLAQMWHEQVFAGFGGGPSVFADRPHAATARALMVHSAYRYDFVGAGADLTRTHQGWGMADLERLYNLRTGMFIVNESTPLTHLSHARYNFSVDGSTPLRVTMVYKDPAGNTAASVARINDLSVKVTSPTAEIFWGNNGLLVGNWSTPGGVSNTVDTIENVFIENPVPGTWIVEVFADEVVQDGNPLTPQTDAVFALVVTGGIRDLCRVDWDGDGMITPSDIAVFITDWVNSLTNQTLEGDFDLNGVVDPSDIAQFITSWIGALSAGGC